LQNKHFGRQNYKKISNCAKFFKKKHQNDVFLSFLVGKMATLQVEMFYFVHTA